MDIYRRYGPALLRKCERMLGNRDDAEDIVQGLFVDLLKRDQGEESLAYLYRAATNRCLNLMRNRKKRQALLERNTKEQLAPARTLLEAYSTLNDRFPVGARQVQKIVGQHASPMLDRSRSVFASSPPEKRSDLLPARTPRASTRRTSREPGVPVRNTTPTGCGSLPTHARSPRRPTSLPPRRRYLLFTFAFIALVTALLLAGQLLLLAILLIVCLIYAPQIVEWVTPGRGKQR